MKKLFAIGIIIALTLSGCVSGSSETTFSIQPHDTMPITSTHTAEPTSTTSPSPTPVPEHISQHGCFSVGIPDDWNITDSSTYDADVITLGKKAGWSVILKAEPLPKGCDSAADYDLLVWAYLRPSIDDLETFDHKTVKHQEILGIMGDLSGNSSGIDIYGRYCVFVKGSTMYTLIFTSIRRDFNENVNIFGDLLSSYKFLKELEVTPTIPPTPSPTPNVNEYTAQFQIKSISASKPNFVGGVNLIVTFKNTSKKTIKYVYFEVVPYNAVGDSLGDEITGHMPDDLEYTGPLGPGKSATKTFKNAWYNENTKYARLVNVSVQYTDGSDLDITEEILDMMKIKGNYLPK